MKGARVGRLCLMLIAVTAAGACFDFDGYTQRKTQQPPPCDLSYGACDTFPQCNCGEGEACGVIDIETGETGCVLPTELQRGEVCLTECAAWLACVSGTCKQYCEADGDCPLQGAVCAQVLRFDQASNTKVAVPGMRACTDQCDPREPQGMCGEGAGCLPYDDLWRTPGHTMCAKAGTIAPGSSKECDTSDDCIPAHACTEEKKCRPWCRVGEAMDCPEPLSCHQLKNPNGVLGYYYFESLMYGACY